MGCSSKPWGQPRPAFRVNASKVPKTQAFGPKYGCFKSHGHGDGRHSKNGYATFFLTLILLGAKNGVATAPKSSNM
jgi:hypothetical protein